MEWLSMLLIAVIVLTFVVGTMWDSFMRDAMRRRLIKERGPEADHAPGFWL